MVIAALEQRRVQSSFLTDQDTVAAVAADFPAIIKNILQVLPDTKTVAVVMGDSPNERFWLEVLQKEYATFADRVSFIWFNNMSFADILKRAAALPPHSVIFFFLMNVDAAGVSFEGDTAMRRLYAVANAPIFTHDDTYFSTRGIVGGPMHSFVNTSRHAVAVTMRVLGGEKPGDIRAPPVRFASPKFDWSEMQRWRINESILPEGSEILFRPPGMWDQYRLQILAFVAALVFQAALICWLIVEHRRRNLAEIQSRNSMTELTYMNRMATAGELSASIAHEVKQPLTGIVAMAGAARRWLATEEPNLDRVRFALNQIETASHHASDIVTNVRSMFKRDTQNRTEIDINKLVWTVMGLVYIDLRKHEIELRTELSNDLPPVLGNRVQLQQVILNLVMNAIDAMHPVQTRVLSVKTALSGRDDVNVSIRDTGIGIDPSNVDRMFKPLFTTKDHGMGMGLSICRSIVESHNGRISVSASDHGGTIFRLVLPTIGRGT